MTEKLLNGTLSLNTTKAMATYSFHWLIMGKSGNWQFLLSHCRYLDFFNRNVSCSPLRFIWILSRSLNLIGCHGNIKGKFSKKYSKINSSEAVWGIKLKLCRIVSNNSLYKNCFLLLLLKHFGCYGNLKFPLTYNGKNENWDVLLPHCRYFDKSFTELFLE